VALAAGFAAASVGVETCGSLVSLVGYPAWD
jgi:hypothetical protein